MFDVAVIGGGIMGAPAARELAERGMKVALIASPEPEDHHGHSGPFGAHHDVSRLTWVSHTDPLETLLSSLSQRAMAELHAAEGGILHTFGSLFLSDPGRDEGRLESARKDGIEILDAGRIRAAYPFLKVPSNATGFLELSSPGIMNPRALVNVERRKAADAGAAVFSTHVTDVVDGSAFDVNMADGTQCRAAKVLIATGAFSNRPGLLPRPLALRMKQETVLLARMTADGAAALSDYPALVYQIAADEISDVYSSPPMQYPDGSIYLKWGCNTLADRWLHSLDEIGAWYRSGDSDAAGELIKPHMERFIPGLDADAWTTHRCAVSYTAHGKPYVDEIIPGRMYVAVGGNGHSAKWSPMLGLMAAELVLEIDWDSCIPRRAFRVVYEGEESEWRIRELWSDRVGSM